MYYVHEHIPLPLPESAGRKNGKKTKQPKTPGSIIAITQHGCAASGDTETGTGLSLSQKSPQPVPASNPSHATNRSSSISASLTSTPSSQRSSSPLTLFCNDPMILDSPQPSPTLFDSPQPSPTLFGSSLHVDLTSLVSSPQGASSHRDDWSSPSSLTTSNSGKLGLGSVVYCVSAVQVHSVPVDYWKDMYTVHYVLGLVGTAFGRARGGELFFKQRNLGTCRCGDEAKFAKFDSYMKVHNETLCNISP